MSYRSRSLIQLGIGLIVGFTMWLAIHTLARAQAPPPNYPPYYRGPPCPYPPYQTYPCPAPQPNPPTELKVNGIPIDHG